MSTRAWLKPDQKQRHRKAHPLIGESQPKAAATLRRETLPVRTHIHAGIGGK